MLHQKHPWATVEQLKTMIKSETSQRSAKGVRPLKKGRSAGAVAGNRGADYVQYLASQGVFFSSIIVMLYFKPFLDKCDFIFKFVFGQE
jgi:hypothetical protein